MTFKGRDFVKFILSLLFSVIATVISLLTFLRSRPRLILLSSLQPSATFIAPGQIQIRYQKGKKVSYELLPAGILVHLSFLNPSPSDISFFQLGFYTDTKMIEAYTMKSVGYLLADKIDFLYTFLDSGYQGELRMPDRPYGVFKSNSYTALDFFMPIRPTDDALPDKISFKFSYAVSKFPYFGPNSQFKEYALDINTLNVLEKIQSQQELMQQLKKSTQYSPKKSPSHRKK